MEGNEKLEEPLGNAPEPILKTYRNLVKAIERVRGKFFRVLIGANIFMTVACDDLVREDQSPYMAEIDMSGDNSEDNGQDGSDQEDEGLDQLACPQPLIASLGNYGSNLEANAGQDSILGDFSLADYGCSEVIVKSLFFKFNTETEIKDFQLILQNGTVIEGPINIPTNSENIVLTDEFLLYKGNGMNMIILGNPFESGNIQISLVAISAVDESGNVLNDGTLESPIDWTIDVK